MYQVLLGHMNSKPNLVIRLLLLMALVFFFGRGPKLQPDSRLSHFLSVTTTGIIITTVITVITIIVVSPVLLQSSPHHHEHC
jgi:hypothetical protein